MKLEALKEARYASEKTDEDYWNLITQPNFTETLGRLSDEDLMGVRDWLRSKDDGRYPRGTREHEQIGIAIYNLLDELSDRKIDFLQEAKYHQALDLNRAFVLSADIEDFRGRHINSGIEEAEAFDKSTLEYWLQNETDPTDAVNDMIESIKDETLSHKKRDIIKFKE
ncbi:MAG: hypothetical protein ACXADH_11085, partial [Candidatus Kariarchaeaceae archaeon]